MKKGAKVLCLIAFLLIIGSAFVGVVTAEEIIIDTEIGESRFTEHPSRPAEGWFYVHDHDTFHTRAYNGNLWYTLCGEEGYGEPLYYGVWQASLPQSGQYEVFVWISDPDYFVEDWPPYRTYTPTQSAVYQIYHKEGMTTKTVNQELRTGGFYSLGTFNFDTLASVILNDRTGESYCSTMVAFDAVKFVPVAAPNTPPYTPSNPSPANHATGQSIHTDLSWTGGDPDAGDTVTYDVYFGTSTRPLKVSTAQSGTTYDPGTLSYSTYYWRIVATDNHGASITGPLWDFTTGSVAVNDMAVTNVNTEPASPNVGQSTTIHVTIKNEGSQQEKNVPVKAYVDGSQVGSTQVTLSAGKSITKSFSWTPSSAKTYSVKGEVGIVSGETHTHDNTKTISVSVSPAPSSMPTTTPSPQTGSIIVTAILDQATFTITGPKTYHGSGKSWSEPNAPVGTYRIIYEVVVKKENGKAVGYDVLKKSEEKTLIAGGSVRFDVEYIKNTPPTRGKISYFCPSCCPTSAWEEPLGESCGKDDAAKYWFVAMRWPYAKWDYNIEDTVSTGLSKGSDWKNKKILVTNPKNGRQVVLEAKDWGPAPWTGRVIDVSPTALSALDAETDEEVNIEFADKNAELGPPPSTKFKTGDLIVTKKKWNLRSDRKIAEECIKITLDKGSEGKVLENDDNGKFVPDNKYYWWYVKFGDYEGWCAEDGLEKSETAPKVAKPVLTYPLKITPEKDKYYVGDTIRVEFTVKNVGGAPITLDKLLVGGRFNDGKLPNGEFPDFTPQSTTLPPNGQYRYNGTLTLTQPGNYQFFIAYYIENPTPEEKELLDENN